MTETEPRVDKLRLMGGASVEDMHEHADFDHLYIVEGRGQNGIYGAVAYVPYLGKFGEGWEREFVKELKVRWNATQSIPVEALKGDIVSEMVKFIEDAYGFLTDDEVRIQTKGIRTGVTGEMLREHHREILAKLELLTKLEEEEVP